MKKIINVYLLAVLLFGVNAMDLTAPRPGNCKTGNLISNLESCGGKKNICDLFIISFLLLFLEMSIIRWFSSTVVFLTFFTNWILLACILGTSVGCLAANNPKYYINSTLPLLWAGVAFASMALLIYEGVERLGVDVGNQTMPQEIFFGAEYRLPDPSRFMVPIEVIAGMFFGLIAMIFLGPGQILGKKLALIPNRTLAYTTNLTGSLAGIVMFSMMSWFQISPAYWFGIVSTICMYYIGINSRFYAFAQTLIVILMISIIASDGRPGQQTVWSPYYKIGFNPRTGAVSTNNIIHQWLVDTNTSGAEYNLPHFLNRDAGGHPFGDVLIIGAGTGNDVQAALKHGATHVDAVEVDPALLEIGRHWHPGGVYNDPRVELHLGDGRNFLRRTNRKYDLIVYALVDSLVLHSGYTNLRLESFLFTEEAFQDVRSKLKSTGIFAMYNYYRWGWVVSRLDRMATNAFGVRPAILPLYQSKRIRSDDPQGGLTILLSGTQESNALQSIRKSFSQSCAFWVNRRPDLQPEGSSFGPEHPTGIDSEDNAWLKIEEVMIDPEIGDSRTPSDNWPFLYLRDRTVPYLYLRAILIVAVISMIMLTLFRSGQNFCLEGRMFFLGAGFMLLETRGVSQLALVFGSTWVVSSVVFCAVISMSLIANLGVERFRPSGNRVLMSLLLISLLVNYFIEPKLYVGMVFFIQAILVCVVNFSPVMFGGAIFASAFRNSRHAENSLGANVAGVVLGGISEYGVMILGFDWLLLVAMLYYLLAECFARKIVTA